MFLCCRADDDDDDDDDGVRNTNNADSLDSDTGDILTDSDDDADSDELLYFEETLTSLVNKQTVPLSLAEPVVQLFSRGDDNIRAAFKVRPAPAHPSAEGRCLRFWWGWCGVLFHGAQRIPQRVPLTLACSRFLRMHARTHARAHTPTNTHTHTHHAQVHEITRDDADLVETLMVIFEDDDNLDLNEPEDDSEADAMTASLFELVMSMVHNLSLIHI